ncbi:nucleotidyltransferase family protein [Deferrisoma palaeochoriense]
MSDKGATDPIVLRLRELDAARRERERRRAEEARAEAERIARAIVERCGAGIRRIVLFGSVAKGRPFTELSDIDLAVEADSPEAFFRAVATALRSDFEVDVVDPADARPVLREAIERDGVVLYERREGEGSSGRT